MPIEKEKLPLVKFPGAAVLLGSAGNHILLKLTLDIFPTVLVE